MKSLLLTFFLSLALTAQIKAPSWPNAQENFKYSNYYEVSVRLGSSGGFTTIQTLMSESQDELINPGKNGLFLGRTFSYAPFSFTGTNLQVRVKKKNITGIVSASADNVEVISINGKIIPTKIDDNTIQFNLGDPKYASVNFKFTDNTKVDGTHSVVKHMLMLFADADNNDLVEPSGTNKVVYGSTTTETQIRNADILVFRAGYHNVRSRWQNNGIRVKSGTKIWIAPGAVVSGLIKGVTTAGVESGVNGVEVYGRGILYLGNYRESNKQNNLNSIYWVRGIDNNFRLPDAIDLSYVSNLSGQVVNKNVVRGIMVGDIMFHGLVTGPTSTIENVKLWGWHDNNDGFRPGNGSAVKKSFLRFVDDALYASDIDVTDTFFWPSYNGAVLTAGWVGPYNTGGCSLVNSTVIYPEWTSRSNNNGILVSQLSNKQECNEVVIKNMEVYGNPVAITNLKPSSVCSGSNCSSFSGQSLNPGVRNVTIENLTINGSLKETNLLNSADGMEFKGIKFKNVKITGFANRFLNNNDRSNTNLFSGNNLTNSAFLDITSTVSTGIIADGTYRVASVKDNKSLDVAFAGIGDGVNVQIYGTDAPSHKKWILKHLGNNIYEIKNENSNKCLDLNIAEVRTDERGRNIHQWTCSGSTNQQWKIIAAGNNEFFLESVKSGQYMELAGGSSANGTNVQQWTSGTEIHKKWKFIAQSTNKFDLDKEKTEITEHDLRIYPNPVLNILNISGLKTSSFVEIFGFTGRKIMESKGNAKIDVSGLASGVYLVKVDQSTILKFVKQ